MIAYTADITRTGIGPERLLSDMCIVPGHQKRHFYNLHPCCRPFTCNWLFRNTSRSLPGYRDTTGILTLARYRSILVMLQVIRLKARGRTGVR